jgi:radical SAM superfamily enzyme YgiQ (UPF0313 family)
VIEELKSIRKDGYEEFSFIDDQFIVGKERVIKIAQAIKKLKLEYGMLARADRILDQEIVSKLSESRCKYVDIGAESFDQGVLDDIGKGIKVEKIFSAIRLLDKYNIDPKINIMFGTSPKENPKVVKDTIKKTLCLPVNHCMFSIATPFPGTEFCKVAENNDWIIKNDDTNPASTAQISYPDLSNQELEKLNNYANRRFYFRWRTIAYQLKKIKGLKSLRILITTLVNYLRNFK